VKKQTNLTNNQDNHNTKIKSREREQVTKTINYPIKNIVAQYNFHDKQKLKQSMITKSLLQTGAIGRRKRDENHSPQKNNLIQDSGK
jgi:hypothetical protein